MRVDVFTSINILATGLVVRVDPSYPYISVLAWWVFIFSLLRLDSEKPWKLSGYDRFTAPSSLMFYAMITIEVIFHIIIKVWWWQ